MKRGRVLGGLAIAAGLALAVAGVVLLLRNDDGPSTDAAPSTSGAVSLLDRFPEVAVQIGTRTTCMLEAATETERARGLMEVTDRELAHGDGDQHDGMVFVYDEDASGGYWMRNTPMPLSIAYVDAGGRLVSSTDMEPCEDSPDCPTYPAAGPYRYAIEVPQGRLDELGITSSARIRVGGACG